MNRERDGERKKLFEWLLLLYNNSFGLLRLCLTSDIIPSTWSCLHSCIKMDDSISLEFVTVSFSKSGDMEPLLLCTVNPSPSVAMNAFTRTHRNKELGQSHGG